LQARDFAFIQAILASGEQEHTALHTLLLDPEMLDALLDQPALYQAVQHRQGTLDISSALYFYLIVRNTLKDAGIDDRGVADYVSSILVSFSRTDCQRELLPGIREPMHYLVDMVSQIEQCDYYHRFFLYAHLGNHTLFLAGLFPKHLEYRVERRGAPGLPYFESMGMAHFKAARNHPLAREFDMAEVYDHLYLSFHDTRKALNQLATTLS